MVYIYALVDPRDGAIFYIGQTATPRLRLLAHISESRVVTQYNGPKFHRINEILAAGDEPVMTILEETTPEKATDRESAWYQQYKSAGSPLTNKGRPATKRKDIAPTPVF